MNYFCCDHQRRSLLRNPRINNAGLNGIDFIEVLDLEEEGQPLCQRLLKVHFINDLKERSLRARNIRIEGGERIRGIKVNSATAGSEANVLEIEVDAPGDFSTYILRLVQDEEHPQPPRGIDPMFAAVEFSFKVECPSDFDCRRSCVCPPAEQEEPEINYLAKDYASFRQLMLDRMAALTPQWSERHAADLGIALVELLAYVGDYLSYQQDAVATEAYLGTARQRVSVRRHARLVDYFMHEGCNARAWVQVQVRSKVGLVPKGTQLFTRIPGRPPTLPDDERVKQQAQVVFETMEDVALDPAHNEIQFYTWSDQRCCLPKGATRATLRDNLPNLKAGDVLIFEEVFGPNTGRPGDADPVRRCAVRLTHVQSQDAKGQDLTDPLFSGEEAKITEIRWADRDALPFPICLSAQTDVAHEKRVVEGVSVARGNIVLADHGSTITGKELGKVLPPTLFATPAPECDHCHPRGPEPIFPRFRPRLAQAPLTFAAPYKLKLLFGFAPGSNDRSDLDDKTLPTDLKEQFESRRINFAGVPSIQGTGPLWSISDGTRAWLIKDEEGNLNIYGLPDPARSVMQYAPADALSAISLHSTLDTDEATWTPKRDLLNSGPEATEFVVETENDGTASIRFGNDELGARPEPLTVFIADYRIGNGKAGNVGAESIAHLFASNALLAATLADAVTVVRNPLPAGGGLDPEALEDVRQRAPAAFRRQERAVTEADYAEVTERHPEVQKAVATFRWTGSWHTVFITIDRIGGLEVDEDFRKRIRNHVERYRMAGYDLEVDAPRFVSLEINLCVCAKPDYFRSDLKQTLLSQFSNRVLPDGRLGVFHPDNFTFGQPVWLSRLIAAAQAVPGVASVHVTTFQRQGQPDPAPLADGKLAIGRLEIARCDNDPDFPEHGVFRLTVGGGK